MNTTIVYPKNPLLKEIIQYFLFISKNTTQSIHQLCYPNTNHCLSLIKGGELLEVQKNEFRISSATKNTSYLTGIYKQPIKISTQEPYQELCINFNPLGMEAVFGKNLSQNIFKNNILKDDQKGHTLFEIVFSNNSMETIQNELEFFLMSMINDEMMQNSLRFNQTNSAHEIEDLNDVLCKSYRSTHRFFVNQLQTTPKEYLQLKKIRAAMPLILNNMQLIEIAHLLGFTDQSHFIKNFKKYTHVTPTQFKQTSNQVDNMLFWSLK